jgi:FkbM family methyltransferase
MADPRKLIADLSAAAEGLERPALSKLIAEFCENAGYVPEVTPARVLQQAKLEVDEVVDVGVHKGTPFLYEAFPDCRFLLVDPQAGAEQRLECRPKTYKYLNVALGRAEGEAILGEAGSVSSLMEWSAHIRERPKTRYPVKVTTLDAVIAAELESDRIGIKIDVEGFEREVVLGLDAALPRVRFVIAELSIRKRLEGAPLLAEFTALMSEKGFAFYNMMESQRASPRRYADVLFLRRDDPRFLA